MRYTTRSVDTNAKPAAPNSGALFLCRCTKSKPALPLPPSPTNSLGRVFLELVLHCRRQVHTTDVRQPHQVAVGWVWWRQSQRGSNAVKPPERGCAPSTCGSTGDAPPRPRHSLHHRAQLVPWNPLHRTHSRTSDSSSPRCSFSAALKPGSPGATSPLHWNISESSPTCWDWSLASC